MPAACVCHRRWLSYSYGARTAFPGPKTAGGSRAGGSWHAAAQGVRLAWLLSGRLRGCWLAWLLSGRLRRGGWRGCCRGGLEGVGGWESGIGGECARNAEDGYMVVRAGGCRLGRSGAVPSQTAVMPRRCWPFIPSWLETHHSSQPHQHHRHPKLEARVAAELGQPPCLASPANPHYYHTHGSTPRWRRAWPPSWTSWGC